MTAIAALKRSYDSVAVSSYLTCLCIASHGRNCIYTLCPKIVSFLMFDNNFGKCGPIFKIFSPGDLQENFLCIHRKDFHLTCNMLLHYLVKF